MATIADALRTATQQLRPHSDTAELEARLLLAHVLDVTTTRLYTHAHASVDVARQQRLDKLVARRSTGEPLAYVTGQCGFWTLDLTITPAVLVPRPDTETLVQTTLDTLPQHDCTVADLGTGSGAIALALARERPHWQVTATDNSDPALACARANAHDLGLTHVAFQHGAWFEPLGRRRFDAIVSNPPYVTPGDVHLQAPELEHEPIQALVAADHGLSDLAHIAAHAPQHLNTGGWLLLEHGFDQGAAVRELLQHAGLHAVRTQPDLAGRDRVTLGRLD